MNEPPARPPDDKPAETPAASAEPKHASKDVVLVHSPTEDQQGVKVLRVRDGTLETGEIRPLREGASLQGVEIVKLKEREGSPVLWDVDVQYDGRAKGTSHPGPARVTSREYRQNYDTIFGSSPLAKPDVN